MRLFDTQEERILVDMIAAHPNKLPIPAGIDIARLASAARSHGVELLLMSEPSVVDGRRVIAMQMRHEATRAELASIASAFARAEVTAVVLKGMAVAERLYDPPWTRPATDIDLLVRPSELPAAECALHSLGYETEGGVRGEFFRARHFHLHVNAPHRTPLELHFLAYRGFGSELSAADLLLDSLSVAGLPSPLRAPSPPRELVYLAVHAAAHRFQRLGWLLDLRLFLLACAPRDLLAAHSFARQTGFRRAFEAALQLLHSRLHVEVPLSAPPSPLSLIGLALAPEPASTPARSATRLMFTLLLCDDGKSRGRYFYRALVDKLVQHY